jgi:hypothetical protein
MDCPQREAVVGAVSGDSNHYSNRRIRGNAAQLYYAGKPSHFDVPMVTHVEGNLWQGGCEQDVILDGFYGVVSLYPWERYALEPGTRRTEFRMHDSSTGVDWDALDEASDTALKYMERGKTLVHCQAGLNRSGLVSAVVLMKQGKTAQEAIDLLRRSRSPMVLCNETFVKQLFELEETMKVAK